MYSPSARNVTMFMCNTASCCAYVSRVPDMASLDPSRGCIGIPHSPLCWLHLMNNSTNSLTYVYIFLSCMLSRSDAEESFN